ncbi:MAG TPA: hypothetical protein VGG61_13675 [Gemmataceae bacterium]
MPDLEKLKAKVLMRGVIEDVELETICQALYADAKIDKRVIEFLVLLRSEARAVCTAFDDFFFEAMKFHVLSDGSVSAEEAKWLRQVLLAHGRIDAQKRRFLTDVRNEARWVSREFEQLFEQCMKSGKE